MANSTVRAQITIPMDSAIPADAVVNTFHFIVDVADALDVEVLADSCIDFYTDDNGSGALTGLMSGAINETGWKVQIYDLADPEPRTPIMEKLYNITSGLAGGIGPAELALCGSFQGPPLSGVNQARRRGRVFIGPLGVAAAARPSTTARTVLKDAMDGHRLATGYTWVVYSPTLRAEGATLAEASVAVTEGWVDDAWDVQRRRGLKPTARTVFP